MKQHTTVKQLNELGVNSEASRKWRGFITGDRNHHGGQDENIAEKSTIGQMVDFIIENMEDIHMEYLGVERKWSITSCIDYPNYKNWIRNKELCDALWEAVKSILNENNI